MKYLEQIVYRIKWLLPSPLTIALLLTIFTFCLAYFFTETSLADLFAYWENGLWGKDLVGDTWTRSWQLPFMVQMMLMLVLGYVLALSPVVDRLIQSFVKYCNTTAKAAFLVTLLTMTVSLFNWGLGLIFGAVFARKVADYAQKKNLKINYGLIGAAGYSGLMVWHGGLSGSAPIKAADQGGVRQLIPDSDLPSEILMNETVFSNMNIVASILLLLLVPLCMFWLGKKVKNTKVNLPLEKEGEKNTFKIEGAERIDHQRGFTLLIGAVIIGYAIYVAAIKPASLSLKFLTPDFINLFLLGLCFVSYRSIFTFLRGIEKSIGSVSGILIQFPFYFGILGVMKYSGLMNEISQFFVEVSTQETFPLYTFVSAGLVNVFVPSGGGQWAIQGPIVLQAANELGVSLSKSIMAIAYGDQLTNMLQPFWALPLLGITKLNVKEIIPYCLFLMVIGAVIFAGVLVFF